MGVREGAVGAVSSGRGGFAMTESLHGWFAGRRVLLTGHTGFKGAWLAAWLREAGAHVTGFALAPDAGLSLYRDADIARDIDSHYGDVRDAGAVARVVRNSRPEIVLHLAAQSLVRRSYREPAETFDTNVMGLVHLFEAVRATDSVQAMVIVTSDKCYENREIVHRYREDEAMGGYDPYSASKGCAELVTSAYRRSFLASADVRVASARAGNVVGGGDWSTDRLVPDLMRGAHEGKVVALRHPEAVRPWQHVLEPLRGYLTLARALVERTDVSEGWNFGPVARDTVAVEEVVRLLAAHWPRVRTTIDRPADAPHEAGLLSLDADKAAQRLGWEPVLGLDECMEWTANWYREFFDAPGRAASLVADELARYAARCADTMATAPTTRSTAPRPALSC